MGEEKKQLRKQLSELFGIFGRNKLKKYQSMQPFWNIDGQTTNSIG